MLSVIAPLKRLASGWFLPELLLYSKPVRDMPVAVCVAGEKVMKRTAKDILQEKGGHLVTVTADASVYQALTLMTQNRVGSVVVTADEKVIGIYTERDLMFHVLEEGFDPKNARIRDHMSENLITANVNEQASALYEKFLGRRIRHLLVEEDGDYIGLLSVGDVVRASLQQKIEELDELNHMVSLEYYENWKELQAER